MQTAALILLIAWTSPFVWRFGREFKQGRFGVDIIALLAIGSSLALNQYAAAAVILLMLTGGEQLETYALRRARKQLTALLERAPSIAHRKQGSTLEDIPADQVQPQDILIVKPGEIFPVDGIVLSGQSTIDESMITGESMPVEKHVHDHVLSGSLNQDSPIEIRALKNSAESKYGQIIELVRTASESKAPIVRLADSYSARFTLLTLTIAALAWFFSQDPLRALAVLVVATPCPLIIATPVAVMSAVSRAAARGIIVKSGGALEILGRARTFVFDKTGTITFGAPHVTDIIQLDGKNDKGILRLAASLDQYSNHVLAQSLVAEARRQHLKLLLPDHFNENLGQGISGILDGETYLFGKQSFLEKNGVTFHSEAKEQHRRHKEEGKKIVYLSRGTRLLGGIAFADEIRKETRSVFNKLKRLGAYNLILLSGDHQEIADRIAKQAGLREAIGDMLPEEKLAIIRQRQRRVPPVIMIGDGVNDAPALAAADVGIAMGAHGATAASESADIVITVDDLNRIPEAVALSKRMLAIATQGILFGMGSSAILMIIAAIGYIPPLQGALLQEIIDVAVILNALRMHKK